jgi:hypothetical protein
MADLAFSLCLSICDFLVDARTRKHVNLDGIPLNPHRSEGGVFQISMQVKALLC